MGVVRGVVAAGPRRWPSIARVTVLAAVLEIAIRTVRLPMLARWVGVDLVLDGSVGTPRLPSPLSAEEEDLVDLAYRVLAHRPFDGTCLRRALLAGRLLRHRSPVLRLGVAKSDGAVLAHAWLEIDGVSLEPEDEVGYEVLDRLPRLGVA